MLLYNNYAGDCLNFDLAQESAREEGIEVETVLVNDEIASAPKGSEDGSPRHDGGPRGHQNRRGNRRDQGAP